MHTAFLLLIGFGFVASAAGAILTVVSVRRAPIGVEDEEGFRVTEPAHRDEFGSPITGSTSGRPNDQLAA